MIFGMILDLRGSGDSSRLDLDLFMSNIPLTISVSFNFDVLGLLSSILCMV